MGRVNGFGGAVLALCAAAAVALSACGSGTKTVTVANAPPVSQTTSTAQPSTTTTSTQTTPTQTTSTAKGTATGITTTHTAPEPAFTKQEAKAEGTSGAVATLRAHGYTPNDPSEYHPDQTLAVLVGTQSGSNDGYGQQAFFFVGGKYLGTDTKLPSATVKVVSQADTEVTLAYLLYRKGDALSDPSGGQAHVTFQLNNGKLAALGKIPPAESAAGLARN